MSRNAVVKQLNVEVTARLLERISDLCAKLDHKKVWFVREALESYCCEVEKAMKPSRRKGVQA